MSSHCEELLLQATMLNGTNTRFNLSEIVNLSNEIFGEIWLNEDISTIFDAKYWHYAELYIGLIILILTAIIISFLTVCCYYPYYDKKQKLIKMTVELGLEIPILQKDIIPHLNHVCNGNTDIMQIIFEFADFTLKHDNLKQYMDAIMISTFDKQPLFHRLCIFISVWNLLLLSYLPVYFGTVHIADSYRSYVEVTCIPLQFKSDNASALFTDYESSVFVLDLSELCGNTLNNYVIYAESYRTGQYNGDEPCYINTNDLIKFRGYNKCYCCQFINVGRCGVCCDGCCKCCAPNACACFWCFVFAAAMLFFWFLFMIASLCPCYGCVSGYYGVYSYYDITLLQTATLVELENLNNIVLTSISGNA